ncbi:MAG: hypothetical protein MI924_15635, partial [Chloroflexales bacterium]|nr:hypothetical protein [Chloroflexales bacterium]
MVIANIFFCGQALRHLRSFQLQHATQLLRRQIVGQRVLDLLQREAQVFEGQNPVETRQLAR